MFSMPFSSFPAAPAEASAMISEGYLKALVGNMSNLPIYWQHALREFPSHPVRLNDPQLKNSIGCTLYCIQLGEFSKIFVLKGWVA